LDEPPDQAAMS